MAEAADQTFSSHCILYAEDEEDDIFFFKRALETAAFTCTLEAVSDGEQAVDYLSGKGDFADRARHPLPGLILLDINMPKKSGFEVLKWIRQQPQFKSAPVLMFTSSSRPEDVALARQLGAEDYLIKPSHPGKFVELVKAIYTRWLAKPKA